MRGSCGTLAVCGSLEAQARAFHPRGLVARLEDVSLLGEETDANAESLDLHPPEWAGDPLVLYVGNLQVYQGIDLLLAGFARTVAEVPAAKLIVVGGTPEEIGHYRREAARLGIAAGVHFAGPRPVESLGRCLQQATVLVSPRIQGTNTPMKVYSYLDSGRRWSPPGCRPIPRCSTTRSLSSSSPTPRRWGGGSRGCWKMASCAAGSPATPASSRNESSRPRPSAGSSLVSMTLSPIAFWRMGTMDRPRDSKLEPRAVAEALAKAPDAAALQRAILPLELEKLTSNDVSLLSRTLQARPGAPDVRLGYLANFTLDPLPRWVDLHFAREGWRAAHYVGGFGQYVQEVLGENTGLAAFSPDLVLLALSLRLLRPEAWAAFAALSPAERRDLREDVAAHVESWALAALERTPATLLVANFPVPAQPAFGVADLNAEYGETEFFLDLNLDLLRRFKGHPRVQIFDLDRLASRFGKDRVLDRRMYYLAKMEWSPAFLGCVAAELVRHARAARAQARKCLVLDLDNTLWGGVVGEEGPAGVKIGPGDPEGEAFLDFHHRLKALQAQGVLLAVCSKNNPGDVAELFDSRPEIPLRLDRLRRRGDLLGAEARGAEEDRRRAQPRHRQPRLRGRQPRRDEPDPADAPRGEDRAAPPRSGRVRRRDRPADRLRAHRRPGRGRQEDRPVPGEPRARGPADRLGGARHLPREPAHRARDHPRPARRPAAHPPALHQDEPVQPDHPALHAVRGRALHRLADLRALGGRGGATASATWGRSASSSSGATAASSTSTAS